MDLQDTFYLVGIVFMIVWLVLLGTSIVVLVRLTHRVEELTQLAEQRINETADAFTESMAKRAALSSILIPIATKAIGSWVKGRR